MVDLQGANIKIADAQDELRAAYVGGAPGVLVSGIVWLAAGIVWTVAGAGTAFTLLFAGGVMIFPLSLLISRTVFRAPKASRANPLAVLGFETTVPLFAGLFVGLSLLPTSPLRAFALFAVVVGARYFAFATLYRDRVYWLLGALLFAVGYGFVAYKGVAPVNVAIVVGAIEIAVAVVIAVRWRHTRR